MFDHPNVFIVEVDNPDLDSSMRAISVNDRPDMNLLKPIANYWLETDFKAYLSMVLPEKAIC